MVTLQTEYFSLEQICVSGQCFRMQPMENGRYQVIAGDRYLEAWQEGDRTVFDCTEDEFETFWKDYFDLDTDYGAYIGRINPNDRYLVTAANCGQGVRILRQDLWEMIVTFLISQQNNIRRIRRCIDLICKNYGEAMISRNGTSYYAFPAPEAFAGLEENALMACNLGYRSKYVIRTAEQILGGQTDLDRIRMLSYSGARKELLELFGVGEKVADCICLFALHHLQAFPVDTHIRQVLEQHYKKGFPNRRYRDCRGVMQQYIFYYELQR